MYTNQYYRKFRKGKRTKQREKNFYKRKQITIKNEFLCLYEKWQLEKKVQRNRASQSQRKANKKIHQPTKYHSKTTKTKQGMKKTTTEKLPENMEKKTQQRTQNVKDKN